MSVKIRLSRLGRKNRPYWRVVAIDSRKKRDGSYLDSLGTYDPVSKKLMQFNEEKISSWVEKGAICSPAVSKLIKLNKKSG